MPLDREAFLEQLLALSRPLQPKVVGPAGARREFIDRVVKLGKGLGPESPSRIAEDLAPFRTHIVGRWQHLEWRLLGSAMQQRAALTPEHLRMLQCVQDAPDLLGPLGAERDEVLHTRLLGHLLCTPAPLGGRLRARLLRRLGIASDGTKVEVRTEVTVGPEMRVDLVLETPAALVYVEQKIDSPDHDDQLDGYRTCVDGLAKSLGKEPYLAFLTASRQDPSSSTVKRIHISHYDLIVAWLPAVLLPGSDAVYLAAYLRSLGNIYQLWGDGCYEQWGYSRQRKTLALFRSIEVKP